MSIYHYLQLVESLKPTNQEAFDEYRNIVLTKQVKKEKFVTNDHHVYPRAFPNGNQYEKDELNIVTLTYYWHLMAHDALVRAFMNHKHSGIVRASMGGYSRTAFTLKKYIDTEDIKILSESEIQDLYCLAKERNGIARKGRKHSVETIDKIINHPNWLKGRENFKNRISKKEYSEAELKAHKEKSNIIIEHWHNIDIKERKRRTANGLKVMNSKKHKCSICGKDGLTKGNLKRWHEERCKFAN